MMKVIIHFFINSLIKGVLNRLSKLNASTRLKVNRDTFFIPDKNDSVYFRNNISSFQMEGSTIFQWIEKLIPMFNGEHSLGELTDGLPVQYRDRVYEIGEILYKNGFVRDVSKDHPHQLTESVLKNYGTQIEFLNSFGESGAYRFQMYRQANVLAIGSGAILVSLVSALLESGLAKFHLFITDIEKTNKKRINESIKNARKQDVEVEVKLIKRNRKSWEKIVESYDSIVYVTEKNQVEEIRTINKICKEEKKNFIPALCVQQIALAGPLVSPDSEGCFESAWRSIHQNELVNKDKLQPFSSVASAMLANVVVFELFKEVTKTNQSEKMNQFFLINQETLEGNWHTFLPHPFVTDGVKVEIIQDFDQRVEQSSAKSGEQSNLFLYLGELTSETSGIFHIWDEGDLKQLPLAQCRIQVVNPLSEGPVSLLPSNICTALTHEEARREAALIGIEMYSLQLARVLVKNKVSIPPNIDKSLVEEQTTIGIGTGETFAECICRGLQKYLSEELSKQQINVTNPHTQLELSAIEDKQCQYYVKALNIMHGKTVIALDNDIFGFPIVYVCTNDKWYRSVGLNKTLALREALQQALMESQNNEIDLPTHAISQSASIVLEKNPQSVVIPECDETEKTDLLKTAMKILKENNKQLITIDLKIDLFNTEELSGIYGVLLREV
jgi:putative thiazole-containing bacteriocin maturation protein